MSTAIEQFNRVLDTYSLSQPLDPRDQARIIAKRHAGLKRLLKRKGVYGISIAASLIVVVFLKKLGIKLSLLQGKIIAGAVATAMTAGSAAGVYQTARYARKIMTEPTRIEEKRADAAPELKTEGAIRDHYRKVEVVSLDDGTRLVGAVFYQDRSIVKVHTVHGVIAVPVGNIRSIRIK